MKAYEKKMIANGKSYTTVGIYMRCLRTILNEAIRTGFLEARAYPFGRGKYEIPVSEGRKMALKLSQIKEILDHPDANETMQEYRNLWLFSCLCNGANFNDILRLKYENIKGEEICFYRGKTLHTFKKKKEIMVYLTPPMEAIIKKWGNKPDLPSKYIFRFLNGCSDPKNYRKLFGQF